MNPLHVGCEEFNGVNRIRLAIENQIGEIEVDALIVHSDILNGSYQGDGSLLPGLVTEILAIALAISGHFAHRRHRFSVYRVIGIFGDKSTVCLDRRNATLLCEVRSFLDVRDASCPRLPWNKTYRQRPLVEIPYLLSRSADDQRSSLYPVLVEGLTQSFRQPWLEIVHECLAGWQAQILDLGHRGIRVHANTKDQAQTQRLPAFVGGYGLSGLRCRSLSCNVVRKNPKVQLGERRRA